MKLNQFNLMKGFVWVHVVVGAWSYTLYSSMVGGGLSFQSLCGTLE